MKARNTNKVLDPRTNKYTDSGISEKNKLGGQEQNIISSESDKKSNESNDIKNDSKFKSRKRLDLKEYYEGILKDDRAMEDYLKSGFPMNLQLLVKYDLTSVLKNSFMYLVSNAPFVYRWLFVSIFKQGLKISELYERYYNIPNDIGYDCPIKPSGLYNIVREALQNTYFAIINNYEYDGEYNTISKFRNLPLLESTLIATYNDLDHLDDHSKELVLKMLSEIKEFATAKYIPVLAFFTIYVKGNSESTAIQVIKTRIETYKGIEEDYTLAMLKKDLRSFYDACKRYLNGGGEVPFMKCLGYKVVSTSISEENERVSSVGSTVKGATESSKPEMRSENHTTLHSVEKDTNESMVRAVNTPYGDINWKHMASLLKGGNQDLVLLFSNPLGALDCLEAEGIKTLPNGDELSSDEIGSYLNFIAKLKQ